MYKIHQKINYYINIYFQNNIKLPNIDKIKHIHEQVMVIMYNSSRPEDFHVKNISSNIILQVCENGSNCQPKLEYQKYSCKFYIRFFIVFLAVDILFDV